MGGMATASRARRKDVEVLTARAELRPDVGSGGPVRLLEPAEAWDVLPRIYAGNRPSRPGTIDRPGAWWQGAAVRTESAIGGLRMSRYTADRDPRSGFARYRPIDTETWFVSDQRTIVVEDFFAPSTEAYLGLLRFLLGLDLIDRVLFWMLPVDDPLPGLLLDRRAARVTAVHDETWLRIVDVPKALAARRYGGDGTVTIAVHDPLLAETRPASPSRARVPSQPTWARSYTLASRGWPRFCSVEQPGAISPSPGWPWPTIRRQWSRPTSCSPARKHPTPGSSSELRKAGRLRA